MCVAYVSVVLVGLWPREKHSHRSNLGAAVLDENLRSLTHLRSREGRRKGSKTARPRTGFLFHRVHIAHHCPGRHRSRWRNTILWQHKNAVLGQPCVAVRQNKKLHDKQHMAQGDTHAHIHTTNIETRRSFLEPNTEAAVSQVLSLVRPLPRGFSEVRWDCHVVMLPRCHARVSASFDLTLWSCVFIVYQQPKTWSGSSRSTTEEEKGGPRASAPATVF